MTVMCFAAGKEVKAETSKDGRFEYTIVYDNYIALSDYNGSEEHVVVPSEIDSYIVNQIDFHMFDDCGEMRTLTLPNKRLTLGGGRIEGCDSLEEIIVHGEGEGLKTQDGVLFNDNTLIWYPPAKSNSSYTVPDGTREFWSGAFAGCENLTAVTIPSTVEDGGSETFEDCINLANVTMSEGITAIGSYMFAGCTSLENITIPDSVTEIERAAFRDCINLSNVTLSNTLLRIGDEAFSGCTNLSQITLPDNVKKIGSSAFLDCTGLTELDLPSELVKIGDNAFCDCTGLNEITIPDQVESLGDSVFAGCSSLIKVNIPASLQTINEEVPFQWCESLKEINVDADNQYYYSQDGILFKKDTSYLLKYPEKKEGTAYAIPEGTVGIGNSAFWGCKELTEIQIPSSVQNIEMHAFYDCSNLTSLEIPEGVIRIEDRICTLCNNLKEVKLPETATYIGMCAFEDCVALEKINLPDNVIEIKWSAFANCKKLDNIILPEKLKTIEADVFFDCKELSTITIPKTVQDIESNIFIGCDNLAEIKVENGNERYYSVDGVLFDKQEKALIAYPTRKSGETYVIPNGIQRIGYGAFCSIDGTLVTVEVPESVEHIEEFAFWILEYPYNGNSSSIRNVKILNPDCQICEENPYKKSSTINENIIIYGYAQSTAQAYAQEFGNKFELLANPQEGKPSTEPPSAEQPSDEKPSQQPSGNSGGTNAGTSHNNNSSAGMQQPSTLPSVGTELSDAASRASYTVATAGATLTYKAPINKKAKKVTIPAAVTIDGITYKVTDIAPNAFKGCKKLKKITIGAGVTTIGKKAFTGCKHLKNIIIKSKKLKKIGKNAFKGINKTAKIKVPKNKLKAYKKMFKKAKLAKSIKVTK